MTIVLWITASLMVLRLAGELVLAALNRAEVRRHATVPPPAAAAIMDPATYAKSVRYTLEKSRFGVLTEIFDALLAMQDAEEEPDPAKKVEILGKAAKNIATLTRASVTRNKWAQEVRGRAYVEYREPPQL